MTALKRTFRGVADTGSTTLDLGSFPTSFTLIAANVSAASVTASAAEGEDVDGASICRGITNGTTHRVVAWTSRHGQTTSNTWARASTSVLQIIDPSDGSNLLTATASFVTVGSEKRLRLTFNTTPPAAYRIKATIYAADNGSASASVSTLLCSGTIGGTASTSEGFQSDLLESVSIGLNNFGDTALAGASPRLGFASRTSGQGSMNLIALDAVNPTNVDAEVCSDGIAVDWAIASSPAARAQVTSWGATGITVTTRDNARAQRLGILAINLGEPLAVFAGILQTDGSVDDDVADYDGFGFYPQHGDLLLTHINNANLDSVMSGSSQAGFIGLAEFDDDEASTLGWNAQDGVSPSNTSGFYESLIRTKNDSAGSTGGFDAQPVGFHSDGFLWFQGNGLNKNLVLLLLERSLWFEPGPAVLLFRAPAPLLDRTLEPGPVAVLFGAPAPLLDRELEPGPATLLFRVPAPALERELEPGPAILRFRAPTPALERELDPGPAVLRFRAPAPLLDRELAPGPATLRFRVPTPALARELDPGPAVLRFRAPAPSLGLVLDPGPAVLRFRAPAPALARELEPGPAVLRFRVPAPSLGLALDPGPAVLRFRAPAPALARELDPGPAVLRFRAPAPAVDREVASEPAVLRFRVPAPLLDRGLEPGPAVLLFGVPVVEVTASGIVGGPAVLRFRVPAPDASGFAGEVDVDPAILRFRAPAPRVGLPGPIRAVLSIDAVLGSVEARLELGSVEEPAAAGALDLEARLGALEREANQGGILSELQT